MGHTSFFSSYSQYKWHMEMATHTRFKDQVKMLIAYEYTKEHIHNAFSSARIQPIKYHSFHQKRHQNSVENGLPCQQSAYPFHTVSTTHR